MTRGGGGAGARRVAGGHARTRRIAAGAGVAAAGGGLLLLGAGRALVPLPADGEAVEWVPPSGEHVSAFLHVRTLGHLGPPVVLLHGLLGSGRYWGAAFDRLAQHRRLVVPDLLGFGASPRPPLGYGPDEHADAVAGTLADLGLRRERAVVVGHSVGALVALRLAARHPELVATVVGLAPPLYPDPAMARRRLARRGWFVRLAAWDTLLARALCEWMCSHRELAAELTVWLRPGVPEPIVRDAVEHSWTSYSQTLARLVLSAEAHGWLDRVAVPVHLIAGEEDVLVDLEFLTRLALSCPRVSLQVWPDAGHDLPLARPEQCVDAIAAALSQSSSP